jgi:hypothetical protein
MKMKKKVLVHSLEVLEQNLDVKASQDKKPNDGVVTSPSGLMSL